MRSINTDILLADLVTLIGSSGLKRGTFYKVTDKDWYLIAVTTSVLKPVSGRLTIMNGDTLPTGIEPDILLVDTGVITTDIQISGIDITNIPYTYTINSALVNCISSEGDGILGVSLGLLYSDAIIGPEIFYNIVGNSRRYVGDELKLFMTGIGTDNTTGRAIIEFHKSPFA